MPEGADACDDSDEGCVCCVAEKRGQVNEVALDIKWLSYEALAHVLESYGMGKASLIQERGVVRQSGRDYFERSGCHRVSGGRVTGEKEKENRCGIVARIFEIQMGDGCETEGSLLRTNA
jgi:hypothetical protein